MENIRFAILLTSFNRKDKTLQCIESLYTTFYNINYDIYLVDDGSIDGTSEVISKIYPKVNLIKGNGNLFWNRGMHLAWKTALKNYDYDYYLWLNDDVILNKDGFEEIFVCSNLSGKNSIISGIINNCENKNEILYGGYNKNGKLLIPNNSLQNIYFMNGNVVMIPKEVYKKIGILDPKYHHDLGDVDYGLRAIKSGINVYCTRKPIACGIKNTISRLRKNNTSFINRLKILYSPLGSPPLINFYFRKKHFGILNATIFYIFQHFLVIISDQVNNLIFKNKYK